MQVFDIIRYLTAEEFLSKLKCDTAIVLVLSECCKVILHATEYIDAKIEETADVVREKTIGFISDDIDTGLRIDIITLQLTILNQAMKYESIFRSKLASAFTAENQQRNDRHLFSTPRNTSKSSSGIQLTNVGRETLDGCLGTMRSQIVLLFQSVLGLIKSIGPYKVLRELCVNDKDLISALLDSSEIELRLKVSVDFKAPEDRNSDSGNRTPDRSVSDGSAYHPAVHATGCALSLKESGVCSEEKGESYLYLECAANRCNTSTHQDSHTTREALGIFYANMHQQLRDLFFDSLSSFLIFLSLINFDASLFCDYLTSPETQALKYLLRVSKRFLDLQNSMDTSIAMHQGRIKMRRKWSHRIRKKEKERGCRYRNKEFLDACTKSSLLLSDGRIRAVNEGKEDYDKFSTTEQCTNHFNSSGVTMRDPMRVVVAWVKSEKVMIIEDDEDVSGEGACRNVKKEENLWAGKDDDVIQSVHPSEWKRHEDERERNNKRKNERNNNIDRDRDRDNPPTQREYRSMYPADSHSFKLYDCSVKFFVDLSDLLVKLAKSTGREISLPFKPAMLVERIARIVSMLEH